MSTALVGQVDLEALTRRAAEVHEALHETLAPRQRTGDLVGVAEQVRRLGLAIERVQRR